MPSTLTSVLLDQERQEQLQERVMPVHQINNPGSCIKAPFGPLVVRCGLSEHQRLTQNPASARYGLSV